jgi:hypothetical protein
MTLLVFLFTIYRMWFTGVSLPFTMVHCDNTVIFKSVISNLSWCRCGRDHMVVGFTTTYAISAYHHWCCKKVRISIRARCTTLCDLISDLRQVGGFLRVLPVSSTNKTDHHDITEILLKVALNTIKQANKLTFPYW